MKDLLSLSPVGLTMPIALLRITGLSENHKIKDTECIIAELWAKENTPKNFLNGGNVPLDDILHECTQRCKTRKTNDSPRVGDASLHDFSQPLNEHDIRVAAATIQWAATPMGRVFYQRFLDEWNKRNNPET